MADRAKRRWNTSYCDNLTAFEKHRRSFCLLPPLTQLLGMPFPCHDFMLFPFCNVLGLRSLGSGPGRGQ